MKFIHNFDTVSAFTESYNGEGYEEPWVSYVKETEAVNYNKGKKWLRISTYGDGTYTSEEEEVLNNIFNYWYIEHPEEAAYEEVEAEIREDIEIYYVGGLTDDFDREDPNTYMYKMTPTRVSYTNGSGSASFYISNGECLAGQFDAPNTGYGVVGRGSIWDTCHE